MSRPGYSLYISPDPRLARNAVTDLVERHPPAGAAWETLTFWGDDPLPDAFWESLTLGGLFTTPKALLVLNAQNLPAAAWKRLSEALGQPRDHVWPHFVFSVGFERGQAKVPTHIAKLAFFRFADKQGWLWSSPGLDQRSLAHLLGAESRRRGLILTREQVNRLVARLPLDAAAVEAEVEKLSLAADASGTISDEHLALVGQEPEIDIFALMRILQKGDRPEVLWRQITAQGGADSFLFPFLAMLTREARVLWQLAHGESVRLPSNVSAEKTALARILAPGGIARIWRLAMEADKGVKTGERAADQALEILLAGLFTLFRQDIRT